MTSTFKRIARLWRQSRIRLPRRRLDASDVRPGDWLEIATRTYRVRATLPSEDGTLRVSVLESVDAPTLSSLLIVRTTEGAQTGHWSLEREGVRSTLNPEDVVLYPVGEGP